ncbi:hypothetical protein [Nitrosomonas sp.]|uniref:hypothetical protein n=1 Tax=Nitrosomonas sp. TaxID=42353 RepID=UPI0025F7818B|nr:hypothetical protein [Nitrosomonas sp.]MBY0483528.1 hypothetical protein [Nitrosomonas sp.]
MHTSVRGSQKLLTPGEQIAESILSLLDEPDSNDKRWCASIFQRLPERFAENAAHDYKETYIFEGRRNAKQGLLKAYGKPSKHSILDTLWQAFGAERCLDFDEMTGAFSLRHI